jgi:N-methylhydantoinase B/oxoprolinase/acetone carboxylase alpha subunit
MQISSIFYGSNCKYTQINRHSLKLEEASPALNRGRHARTGSGGGDWRGGDTYRAALEVFRRHGEARLCFIYLGAAGGTFGPGPCSEACGRLLPTAAVCSPETLPACWPK